MSSFDPMKFGMPPEGAIEDPDALEGALAPEPSMGQVLSYQPQMNLPFLEEVPDIPRGQGQMPMGMMNMGPMNQGGMGQMSMPGMDQESPAEDASEPQGFEDEEAVRQAILDSAARDNAASRAYQEKVIGQNEEESAEKRRVEAGEI